MDALPKQWDAELLYCLQETIDYVFIGLWNFYIIEQMIMKHILVSSSFATFNGPMLEQFQTNDCLDSLNDDLVTREMPSLSRLFFDNFPNILMMDHFPIDFSCFFLLYLASARAWPYVDGTQTGS